MTSFQLSHGTYGAFNHERARDAEEEYDRLRNLARQEAQKRNECFDRSRRAYESGDGAAAKELSEQGKEHARLMDMYNKQASEFIFRENNAPGRVDPDTIDLHGQFVEEAEEILEQRIRAARQRGDTHLHVIVGKGNHSVNHVQKLKPRVEQVCRDLGLRYHTEENAGRIYVDLTGGGSDGHHHQPSGHPPQQHHRPHPQYPRPQPGHQHHHEPHPHPQQPQQDEVDQLIGKVLPKVVRKLGDCCIVM
ncbi:hypothetical protein VTN49DRAFT_2175 [Thermomyces lanuginosus]|uniref:uncharacterized protein n=1 Tax=Thermomyces lanuginosus TaxID=5541 RepID=UPI003743C04C